MTRTDEHKASTVQAARHHRTMFWLTLVGVVAALIALVPAFAGWYGEDQPDRPDSAANDDGRRSPSAPLTETGSASSSVVGTPQDSFTFLSTLIPQGGAANLTPLPRDLRDDPTYGRAITIQCPTNNSADKIREVTYPLRGNYLEFTATVKPSFVTYPDARAHVFAIAAHRQPDDTLVRKITGQQLDATGLTTGAIKADVEGAVELTIQIKCDYPEGVVIISDGRLTRAH